MKLRAALDLFLQVDRSPETLRTYRAVLTRMVNEIGPGRPLDLVQYDDLVAYVDEMRHQLVKYANHPTRPAEQAPLSTATINKRVRTIRTFFNWCVRHEFLRMSPARGLTARRQSRPMGLGKAAKADEVSALMDLARYNVRDWAIVLLLCQSACRACELVSLQISQLDLEGCHAWVDGKGDNRRTIYFGPETADAIREWLAVRPKVDHDYVFTSTRGHGPLKPDSITLMTKRLCRTAGVEPRGTHSFRHYVAMTLVRAKVPPTVIQAYLGHSNIQTTMGYIASIEEEDIREAGRLLAVKR